MKRLLTLLTLVFGAIALICAAAWQLQIPSERQRFNASGGEPRGGPTGFQPICFRRVADGGRLFPPAEFFRDWALRRPAGGFSSRW